MKVLSNAGCDGSSVTCYVEPSQLSMYAKEGVSNLRQGRLGAQNQCAQMLEDVWAALKPDQVDHETKSPHSSKLNKNLKIPQPKQVGHLVIFDDNVSSLRFPEGSIADFPEFLAFAFDQLQAWRLSANIPVGI